MKKKKIIPFEEFKAGRKTYLVFPWDATREAILYTAAKRFHCKFGHLISQVGLVEGRYLYLDLHNPKIKKGQKKVYVVEYSRNINYLK